MGEQTGFVLVLDQKRDLHWLEAESITERSVCSRPLGQWIEWSVSAYAASRKAGADCETSG